MFDQFEFPKKSFDLICLFHVLEHLPDPIDALYNIKEILQPNGSFFIEVPDILHPYSGGFDDFFQNAHLYNFSLRTLKALLKKADFGIVTHERFLDFIRVIAPKTGNTDKSSKQIEKQDYRVVVARLLAWRFYYYYKRIRAKLGIRSRAKQALRWIVKD